MCADSRGYLEQAAGPGGCMSSFSPESADAREKGKLFSVSGPRGMLKLMILAMLIVTLLLKYPFTFRGKCQAMQAGRMERDMCGMSQPGTGRGEGMGADLDIRTHRYPESGARCDYTAPLFQPIYHLDYSGQPSCTTNTYKITMQTLSIAWVRWSEWNQSG